MKNDWNTILEDATDHAVIVISEDGNIEAFSRGAELILGWSRGYIVGKPFADLFTIPDRSSERPARELESARREGSAEDSRWHLKADGTSVYLNGTTRWIEGKNVFIKIARDVTRQPQTERRTEAFLHATQLIAKAEDPGRALEKVVEQLGDDLLWDVSILWRLEQPARVWLREDTKPFESIPQLADISLDEPPLSRCLQTPGVDWTTEIRGSNRFEAVLQRLEIRTMLLIPFSSETRVEGVIGFLTRELRPPDRHIVKMMTNLGNLIERLFERRASMVLLRSSLAMRDELIATVSHDLRTPLTTIRGWSQMMREGDEEARAEAASRIDIAIRHQEELLEDLLATTKAADAVFEIRTERVDLKEFIPELVRMGKVQIEDNEIDLDVVFPNESCEIEIDPRRVRQVLWNLLSNAIKFTSPGGAIKISVENSAEHVTIRVSDSGRGMTKEDLDRAFSRFWSRDDSGAGTGLGLHVAKTITEAHGGTIRAESEGPGRGSTFVVELPRQED